MVIYFIGQIYNTWDAYVVLDSSRYITINNIYRREDKYVMFLSATGIDTSFVYIIYVEMDTSLNSIYLNKVYRLDISNSGFNLFFTGYEYIDSIDGGYLIPYGIYKRGFDSLRVVLAKFDSLGNLLWTKNLIQQSDSNYWFLHQAFRILSLPDGYLIFSVSDSFDNRIDSLFPTYPDEDPLIIKLDRNGNFLWAKIWKWELNEFVISDVIYDGGDTIIFGGWHYTDREFPSRYKPIIGMLDTSGNPIMVKLLYTDYYSGIRNFFILDSNKILAFNGVGLGAWAACGGMIFDRNLNPIKCGLDDRLPWYHKANNLFTYDVWKIGDKIFGYGCIIDTSLSLFNIETPPKDTDDHVGKVFKYSPPYIYTFYPSLTSQISKMVYTGDIVKGCSDSTKFAPSTSCALHPVDSTGAIEVVSKTLTPQDVPFVYEAYHTIKLDTFCNRSVVFINEDKPLSCAYNKEYKVYTVLGRLVGKGKGKVYLKDLPKGVYIINRKGKTYKIIKR